jgi:hypothetical protein
MKPLPGRWNTDIFTGGTKLDADTAQKRELEGL